MKNITYLQIQLDNNPKLWKYPYKFKVIDNDINKINKNKLFKENEIVELTEGTFPLSSHTDSFGTHIKEIQSKKYKIGNEYVKIISWNCSATSYKFYKNEFCDSTINPKDAIIGVISYYN